MSQLSKLLSASDAHPINASGARVRTAVAVPNSPALVAATDNGELVVGNTRVSVQQPVLALAFARYVTVAAGALPTESMLIAALLEGAGLKLFSLPELNAIEGHLATSLTELTKNTQLFASDAAGCELVGESFRVALAADATVRLLEVNIGQGVATVLAETQTPDRVIALAFADMTVVASTRKNHCMLRIARSGGMALAAAVPRSDVSHRRPKVPPQQNDAGAAVLSFFGVFFARRGAASALSNQLAFALPDGRWILIVNNELVTYSSFGAKLEDMENTFKSRQGIDIPESAIAAALSSVGSPKKDGKDAASGSLTSTKRQLRRTTSVSSLASVSSTGTAATAMTLVDEARATRAEKPPIATVFASPFVLCVTDKNELLAFAANGSIPGVVDSLKLREGQEGVPEVGAKILACHGDDCLAIVYWPSGRVMKVNLSLDLETLIQEREEQGELRQALALVPINQFDRTIALRRKLASEARDANWHDAAIHHMQHVVNICISREGVNQLDLIAEAVELRGPKGTGWDSDAITATFWADFLFRLRRRIMQASSADVDILETLCRADETATRVKSLLAVKHSVPLEAGEALVAAGDSALWEGERIEALTTLYTSLGEHDKALVLLENSGLSRTFDAVCAYLAKSISAYENPDVFFQHIQWVAKETKSSERGEDEFFRLLGKVIDEAAKADRLVAERSLERVMQVVVEHTPHLVNKVVNRMSPPAARASGHAQDLEEEKGDADAPPAPTTDNTETVAAFAQDAPAETAPKPNAKAVSSEDAKAPGEQTTDGFVPTELLAIALLAGMSKADILEKRTVFEQLRALFRSRVLHRDDTDYHSEALLKALMAVQNQSMALHEELAFLLGRQGRHEAAANELAAERTLSTAEATRRLERLLPSADKSSAVQALAAAYVRVSAERRVRRVDAAAELVRREGGLVDVEKVLKDVTDVSNKLTLSEMKPFLQAALIAGNERLRLAELLRALRVSEVRRVREEVLMRRRRCVIIGHDRACSICTRRIGESVFAAYPDGSVSHLVCHMSSAKP